MPTRSRIVTRTETTSSNSTQSLNKGSKLTFAEMDSNFIELQNQSIGIGDDNSTVIDVTAGNTLTVAGSGGIQTSVSGQTLTIDASSITSSSLGDLTAVGSTLQSPSNADITLDPSGTGKVVVNANIDVTGDLTTSAISIVDNMITSSRSNDDLTLAASGTGSITFGAQIRGVAASGGLQMGPTIKVGDYQSSGGVTNWGAGKNITVGSYAGQTGAYTMWTDGGEIKSTLASVSKEWILLTQTEGGGVLTITTPAGGPEIRSAATAGTNTPLNQNLTLGSIGTGSVIIDTISIKDNTILTNNSNANLELSAAGTGNVVLSGLVYPNADGTADQVLSTNGSGVLSWVDSLTNATTFVGDDSTGTAVNPGETFKFVGTQNVTTAVSGDTLTITGPNLSSYITNSPITVVGDDSTGTTLNTGETIKIAGGTGITTAVSGDTITVTAAGGDTLPSQTSNSGKYLTTDGTDLSWGTVAGGSADTGDFVFTGNEISTASSNADFEVTASGTGRIVLQPNGYITTDFVGDRYISIANAKTRTSGIFEYEQYGNYSGATQLYPLTRQVSVKTDGTDQSGSGARVRNFDLMSLDLNGSAWTSSSSSISRGLQRHYSHTVTNRHATDAAEIRNVAAHQTTMYAGQIDLTADLTIQDMAGYVANLETLNNTATTTINNAYGFYWNPDAGANGTAVIDNAYGLYINSNNSGIITNNYSIYTEDKAAKANPGAINEYNEYAYESTHSASGTYTVDANNGNLQTVTLGANITSFTMSNFPASTNLSKGITLYLVQDGTGARTISFTAGNSETFKFANGSTSSTVSAAADIQTVYIFSKYNGSSLTYYWTLGPVYS